MFSDHFYRKYKEIIKLRDFAKETLLKNGTVTNFTEDTLRDSKLVISNLRDFAKETLPKTGVDEIVSDPENFCDLKDFTADTLLKNGTDKNPKCHN